MPRQLQPQLALDEQAITNPDLERALERRLQASDDAAEVRGVYRKANDEVTALLALINFPTDSALRIGRFRITKSHVEARHVEFDADATERVRISLAEDSIEVSTGQAKPAATDDDDLRPTGDVNPAALRGEADRASLN